MEGRDGGGFDLAEDGDVGGRSLRGGDGGCVGAGQGGVGHGAGDVDGACEGRHGECAGRIGELDEGQAVRLHQGGDGARRGADGAGDESRRFGDLIEDIVAALGNAGEAGNSQGGHYGTGNLSLADDDKIGRTSEAHNLREKDGIARVGGTGGDAKLGRNV